MLESPPTKPTTQLRSSEHWRDYFEANAKSLMDIPWEEGVAFSDEELRTITSSVQGFQRGESSEGGYLYQCAKQHALETGDPAYVDAMRLFIHEEHRHARDLAKILTLVGIPLIKKTWPDTVFRGLRHLGGLEVSISVLITAEIIAKVYYRALREATNCGVLRRLCDQILRDEQAHVEFQSERLAILRRGRSGWVTRLAHGLHAVFMVGTCAVVQLGHGRAMKRGGFGMGRFFASCRRELKEACLLMDARNYRSMPPSGNAAASTQTE